MDGVAGSQGSAESRGLGAQEPSLEAPFCFFHDQIDEPWRWRSSKLFAVCGLSHSETNDLEERREAGKEERWGDATSELPR